jgi:hypothetical protein
VPEVVSLRDAVAQLGTYVSTFDPRDMDRDSLLAAADLFGRAAKLAGAGTLLIAPVVEELGAFRRDGHRNAADMFASMHGVSTGAAIGMVNTGRKLQERPDTAADVRNGDLSATQAGVITGAHKHDEKKLRKAAKRRGVKGLKEEAERCAAARRSEEDAMERYGRVHRDRYLRTFERDGGVAGSFFATPDEAARLLSGIAAERERLFKQAHRDGNYENNDAYAIDALVNVVAGSAPQPAKPKAALSLRADMTAIIRGWLEVGEKCEIEGVGPIPVTVARWLLGSANAYGEIVDGDDVRAITNMTRNIPTKLDRALSARSRTCEVPGCDVAVGLERDHIDGVAQGGPTCLDNLCRLCRLHHRMKTLFGWKLTGPPGRRQWTQPELVLRE